MKPKRIRGDDGIVYVVATVPHIRLSKEDEDKIKKTVARISKKVKVKKRIGIIKAMEKAGKDDTKRNRRSRS